MTTEVAKTIENVPVDGSMSPLVQAAMNGSLDTEKLKELLAIQKEYEANEAKKAYHKAVSAFKASPVIVTKDKFNNQYKSYYTSIENMVNTVNKELSKFNLSAHWEVNQEDEIRVTCILSHELGYSERSSMKGPPDTSGAKNQLQQIKSTVTYLKLATYEAVTGIASSLVNVSDDANSATVKTITKEQIETLLALITEVKADEKAFMKICKVEAWEQLPTSMFAGAVKRLEAKRNANA